MGLREFLRLPKSRHQKKSKAKSELGSIEGPSDVDLAAPRLTESTPDLQTGASTSLISGLPASRGQESNDRPTIPDKVQPDVGGGQGTHSSSSNPTIEPATKDENENKSNLKALASSGAKFVLRGVRDTADAFGPLKSVAGGLCFILENCERTKANKQSIESLAPRIEALAESLCAPVPKGDLMEGSRRKVLEQKLQDIHQNLNLLAQQGKVEGFFSNIDNADQLQGLVEDIRDAIVAYQASLQQDIYNKSCQLIESADLALLDRMYRAADAGYRSGNRQGCLKGTRQDVLRDIENWLTDKQDQRIFWLNGLAGTGKSTIAQTFSESSFADGKLGASFFCSRDFADRSNLQTIFPTLAFQLAHKYPLFRENLLPVLKAVPDVGRESLCSQMEKLIVLPFQAANFPTLIIIDALDECKDGEPASAILSILSRFVDEIPNVKFFITGRPEPQIRSGFRLTSLKPITEVLRLQDVEKTLVDNDIKLFFRTKLAEIARSRSDCDLGQDWPNPLDVDFLCRKAAGFFIYASTVVNFVASKSRIPTEQLNLVISLPQSTTREGRGIDPLYTQVLDQAVDDVDASDEDKEKIYSRFKIVVGAVALVLNPLSAKALSDLLRVSHISTTLRPLHSLLLMPEPEKTEGPIRPFHKSFPDFLTNPERCKGKWFHVDPAVYHAEILLLCLDLMKKQLKRNICRLDDYVVLGEVEDISARQKKYIGDALEYACHFWTKHLMEIPSHSPYVEKVQKAINDFFNILLLHWIEVLILTNKLDVGVVAMNDIGQWCASAGIPCEWTNDSQRLLLEHFDTIYHSPSQLYHSALPFCPTSSWLKSHYRAELLNEVKVVKGLPEKWATCSRTVSFDEVVRSLAYWDNTIAVGLQKGKIIILNAFTGSHMAIFTGHTGSVASLAFSPNGVLLVSGSDDRSVKLWDVQTGGIIKTFSSNNVVETVSISADSVMIASGLLDGSAYLHNIRTGECHSIRKEPGLGKCSVNFSPTNPQLLITVSAGGLRQWDMNGNQIGQAYNGKNITFSPDGTRFIQCKSRVVTVQEYESKEIIATFHTTSIFNRSCFSPDGKLIAVSDYSTIYIWDTTSPDLHPIDTFIGHTDAISGLAFSSPSFLVSTSYDSSIKFWQIGTSSADPLEAYQNPASNPSAIMVITLQAKNGITLTSHQDGMARVWDTSTGLCKASFQTPAKLTGDSNKRDIRLIDGRITCIWYEDRKIHIWDAEKGELLSAIPLSGLASDSLVEIMISGDGSKVFCWGTKYFKALSMQTGEVVGEVKIQEGKWFGRVLALDGSQVWVDFSPQGWEGWDFGVPGSSPVKLIDIPPRLHPNGTILWDTFLCRVQEKDTGNVLFQLAKGFGRPSDVQWDGQHMVICLKSGRVFILDFSHILFQ